MNGRHHTARVERDKADDFVPPKVADLRENAWAIVHDGSRFFFGVVHVRENGWHELTPGYMYIEAVSQPGPSSWNRNRAILPLDFSPELVTVHVKARMMMFTRDMADEDLEQLSNLVAGAEAMRSTTKQATIEGPRRIIVPGT